MRVLVCGGREFDSREAVFSTLDHLHSIHGFTEVYHGAARGADRLVGAWARERGITCKPMAADWQNHGKAAGPIRNNAMLKQFRPDAVISFPGGDGTKHMVQIAVRANLPVVTYHDTICRPWVIGRDGEIFANYYKGKTGE